MLNYKIKYTFFVDGYFFRTNRCKMFISSLPPPLPVVSSYVRFLFEELSIIYTRVFQCLFTVQVLEGF